jgi:hypothetical protein
MTTLKQKLEELEHLNTAIQKSNYYTEEEAHEEIILTVKEWLQQKHKNYLKSEDRSGAGMEVYEELLEDLE